MQSEGQASSLFNKLFAVMSEIDFIEKDKANSAQNYRYASEQIIKIKLHDAFVRHRMLCLPKDQELLRVDTLDTRSGGKMLVTVIKHHFEFVDLDSGERYASACLGSGSDSLDKGAFKAITGAIKYALTTTFLIPTGDDPEGDGKQQPAGRRPERASGAPQQRQSRQQDPDALITEAQQKRMYALMHKAKRSVDEVKAIIARHGFASSKDVTVGKYEAICTEIEAPSTSD